MAPTKIIGLYTGMPMPIFLTAENMEKKALNHEFKKKLRNMRRDGRVISVLDFQGLICKINATVSIEN